MVNPRCFLDISIGGELEGRIVIELLADVVPRTAANFLALCLGNSGKSTDGYPLHYKGTRFHRVVKGLMIQGGDNTTRDGTGGESIYGPTFEDENFKLKHERKGFVSMANNGANTNGSQFLIVTTRAQHFDGHNVLFGKVIKGMGVVRTIEHTPTVGDDFPIKDVIISDCGEIPEGEDDGVSNFSHDGDKYPDWPTDLDEQSADPEWWMEAVESAKCFGNDYFNKGDHKVAIRKYRKALRYLDLCWEKGELDELRSLHLRKTKTVILTNSAACKLRIGDYQGALTDCEYALYHGEDNVKALFRQGQAQLYLNDLDGAIKSLSKASQLEPNDTGIKRELGIVKKKIAERHDKERKAYARMFTRSGQAGTQD